MTGLPAYPGRDIADSVAVDDHSLVRAECPNCSNKAYLPPWSVESGRKGQCNGCDSLVNWKPF